MKKTKIICMVISLACILGFATAAHAEWHFGIGTGFAAMNVDGDLGFTVNIAGIGSVKLDVDLSPSDIMDYMETAIGFGGFATDGTWMIQASFSHISLEDEPAITSGPITIKTELSFDVTHGDLIVGYPFFRSEGTVLRAYTGFRYTNTELDTKVVVRTDLGDTKIKRNIDEDWTDVLIGVSADVPFANKWSWNTMVDGGFGGSEGSYYVNSGINWRFAAHWSTGIYGTYYAIEYETGSKGDKDWYLYDVDEATLGLKIAYVW